MPYGKKGVLSFSLVTLLLTIIGLLLIVMVVFLFWNDTIDASDKYVCWFSVLIKDSTSFKGYYSSYSLKKCLHRVTITQEDDKKIKHVLAEEMKDCWWKMHEGKRDIIGKWHLPGKMNCLVCSEVKFAKKGLEIEKFDEYLDITHLNDKLTYAQYFGNNLYRVREEIKNDPSVSEGIKINTEEDYYIVFGVAKEFRGWVGIYNLLKFGAIGAGAGFLSGLILPVSLPVRTVTVAVVGIASNWHEGFPNSYTLMLVPKEEIFSKTGITKNKICDNLIETTDKL